MSPFTKWDVVSKRTLSQTDGMAACGNPSLSTYGVFPYPGSAVSDPHLVGANGTLCLHVLGGVMSVSSRPPLTTIFVSNPFQVPSSISTANSTASTLFSRRRSSRWPCTSPAMVPSPTS